LNTYFNTNKYINTEKYVLNFFCFKLNSYLFFNFKRLIKAETNKIKQHTEMIDNCDEEEEEEEKPAYNFRALLRKTGQDLTANTLTRYRSNSETKKINQIDFRNVLKSNNRNRTSSYNNDKIESINNLVD
jgi:hypothetical protein